LRRDRALPAHEAREARVRPMGRGAHPRRQGRHARGRRGRGRLRRLARRVAPHRHQPRDRRRLDGAIVRGRSPNSLRLVLDTQIWLDWLVFDDPGVRALRNAVEKGRAEIWMNAACDTELERVLAYDLGKHSIAPAAQATALAHARRIAQRLETELSAA